MGQLEGRVALITGAARGIGRSVALRLAEEGADIAAVDCCRNLATVPYSLATPEQLQETAQLVEAQGRRAIVFEADVRDPAAMASSVARTVAEFGKVDIACANAGVLSFSTIAEMSTEMWADVIDTNLGGVFHTIRAVITHMIEREYGRVVAISSMAGRGGTPNIGHYVASKWGVIGLVKSLAIEVASHGITANAVCPAATNTDQIQNDATYRAFLPDVENPTREQAAPVFAASHAIPVPWIEPREVANAVLWLCSDEARYVTGAAIPVAAGYNARGSD